MSAIPPPPDLPPAGGAMPPWPPPGTQPGAAPAAAEPVAPAAPPPTEPPPPFGDDGDGDGDEGVRAPVWLIVLVPLLIVALVSLLVWRSRGDDGEGAPNATTGPTAPTTAPETGTSEGGASTSSPPTGPEATTVVPTTVPGATTVPPPSTAGATSVPGGVVSPGPTGPAGPTTLPPASTRPTLPPTTPEQRAVVVAQEMATALASGDWSEARRLSPTDQRTNAEFEQDYAGLDASTVVPAASRMLSSGLVDLRVGLVAHESRPTGPQTSLFCAHWIVDPADQTVQRLSAQRLRTDGGTVPVSQVEDDLRSTCATLPLR